MKFSLEKGIGRERRGLEWSRTDPAWVLSSRFGVIL